MGFEADRLRARLPKIQAAIKDTRRAYRQAEEALLELEELEARGDAVRHRRNADLTKKYPSVRGDRRPHPALPHVEA